MLVVLSMSANYLFLVLVDYLFLVVVDYLFLELVDYLFLELVGVAGDPVHYSVSDSPRSEGSRWFAIDSSKGLLRLIQSLDYEKQKKVSVCI